MSVLTIRWGGGGVVHKDSHFPAPPQHKPLVAFIIPPTCHIVSGEIT